MKHCIIDASVAVKWFFREEVLADQAVALLQSRTGIIVPDYFYLEMNSVFTKLVRKRFLVAEKAREMSRALKALPTDVMGVSKYRDMSMDLSIKMNIGYYDCLYAAPACITRIPLVTADRRLFNAFCETELAPCVVWLGDYA